jgi:glyoxylase-like metal-dependent hydrolase (beta-lactamase superfamily II)
VRYVINTHWHGDHISGNQVYRDTFPGVELIAHATAREDMVTEGATARKQFVEFAPGTIASLRDMMKKNKGLDGDPLTSEERESHLTTIALAEHALAEAPGVRPTPPTLTLEDRLTLVRRGRTIELRYLGRGHTRGDLVVHLPREGIVFTGDLVAWPVPLVGTTSFPLDFGATLERVLALRAATIVPGHGKVLRDDLYVRLLVRLLASIKQQTEAAVARGETLEQARKSVDLGEFRKAIAGDSKVRNLLFSQYVADPAVGRAFQAASAPRF